MTRRLLPYLLIGPALVVLAVFYVYPIGYNVFLSFFSWNMRGEMTFLGVANYAEMFTDPAFYQILRNTIFYMGMEVMLVMVLGLALALYLSRTSLVKRLVQTLSFTPNVVPLVSVSLIFVWLMDADTGLLNWLLGLVGTEPVGWLRDPDVALFSLVLVGVWKAVGFNALIIVAALSTVPRVLYEAADLDNAGSWTCLVRVTLPMISPTLFFLTVVNVIGAFQAFDTINVMTQGGPSNATNTLIFSIYKQGFEYYRVGYAAAMATVLMVLVGVLTIFYFRSFQKQVHYR